MVKNKDKKRTETKKLISFFDWLSLLDKEEEKRESKIEKKIWSIYIKKFNFNKCRCPRNQFARIIGEENGTKYYANERREKNLQHPDY